MYFLNHQMYNRVYNSDKDLSDCNVPKIKIQKSMQGQIQKTTRKIKLIYCIFDLSVNKFQLNLLCRSFSNFFFLFVL